MTAATHTTTMMTRLRTTRARAAVTLLLTAALLGPAAGCGSSEEPAAPPAPRVLREAQRPAPAPTPRNPVRRLLDEDGELRESANTLFGFRLPVGVRQVSQDAGGAVLHLEVPLERLARFYLTRGYPVVEGRGGFVVSHAAHTLAEEPNAARLARAELYLRHKVGRVHELRFFLPAADPEGAAGAPGTPERPVSREEARRVWQETFPGEPFPE
jgi:hypothetical protein